MHAGYVTRVGAWAGTAVIVAMAAAVTSESKYVTGTVFAQGQGGVFTSWSPAINVQSIPGTDPELNTASNDGCPTLASDGRTLFMASNRPGGLGGQDIWMATRESPDAPWGAPVNLGAPVNSAADDFCPSPTRNGHLFFFVSTRAGGCGGSDIYVTRWRNENLGWEEPVNLGCDINSAGNEASPFLVHQAGGTVLYFSSNRAGGYSSEASGAITGDDDIYVSEWHGGVFEPAQLVAGINTEFNDSRPNLSRDGRELFFDSNRTGTIGGADIYSAFRASALDPWSVPENLGSDVNSPAAETRASLSWDGTTLVFGSMRAGGEGSTDVYMTTRVRVAGQ
jgi:Tol biopolymer transport system component